MKECILIFSAHNDDQIIGAGGTLAKYAKEGKEIITYIFSYGEKSHPHFQRKIIVEQRVKEARKSNKLLGIKDTVFFGINEGKFEQDPKIKNKIKTIIKEKRPSKIFIHSIDDPHPDHRAVHHIVLDCLKRYKGEVYSYEVWNIISFRRRNSPKLIVDVTNTFKKKVEALKMHESQTVAVWTLLWNIYLKAFINGINNGVKYAEIFYRLQ